eukprot:3614040-Karenia_brevis.AAC.1
MSMTNLNNQGSECLFNWYLGMALFKLWQWTASVNAGYRYRTLSFSGMARLKFSRTARGGVELCGMSCWLKCMTLYSAFVDSEGQKCSHQLTELRLLQVWISLFKLRDSGNGDRGGPGPPPIPP